MATAVSPVLLTVLLHWSLTPVEEHRLLDYSAAWAPPRGKGEVKTRGSHAAGKDKRSMG